MKTISIPRLFKAFIPEGVSYIFGDASYIREQIANLKSAGLSAGFPIIGLYWSSAERVEVRPKDGIAFRVSLSFIIADSSNRDSNEKRMDDVYDAVLHPIMESLISSIEDSGLFELGYNRKASYTYSDGYEAPFHGLVDNTGKDLAEVVDYVSVKSLRLELIENECKLNDFIKQLSDYE